MSQMLRDSQKKRGFWRKQKRRKKRVIKEDEMSSRKLEFINCSAEMEQKFYNYNETGGSRSREGLQSGSSSSSRKESSACVGCTTCSVVF